VTAISKKRGGYGKKFNSPEKRESGRNNNLVKILSILQTPTTVSVIESLVKMEANIHQSNFPQKANQRKIN